MGIRQFLCAAGAAACAFGAVPAVAATPPTQANGEALILIPLT